MVSGMKSVTGKKEGLAIWLSLLLLLATNHASAQSSITGSLAVTALVVPSVTITCSAGTDGAGDIDFGLVLPNTTSTINPKTSSSASLFTVAAGANMPMTATFNSPSVTLTDSLNNTLSFIPNVVGAQSASSQSSAAALTSGGSIIMNSTGLYFIWLGGAVSVPSSASPGAYKGVFSLTVTYK